MTETAFESVARIEPSEPEARTGTVVMKFGGTSVADPEKIPRVWSKPARVGSESSASSRRWAAIQTS
jgi:hypothetical protein